MLWGVTARNEARSVFKRPSLALTIFRSLKASAVPWSAISISWIASMFPKDFQTSETKSLSRDLPNNPHTNSLLAFIITLPQLLGCQPRSNGVDVILYAALRCVADHDHAPHAALTSFSPKKDERQCSSEAMCFASCIKWISGFLINSHKIHFFQMGPITGGPIFSQWWGEKKAYIC